MKILYLWIVFITFFYFSCSNQPIITDSNFKGEYYAFCTLSPNREYQQVLVGQTLPEHFPIDVKDAQVTIHNENQFVGFQYIDKGYYGDLAKLLKINFGETYNLQVCFSDGQILAGKATPPDSFTILAPTPNDTIIYYMKQRLDTTRLGRVIWTKSTGARYYMITLAFKDSLLTSHLAFSSRTRIYFPEVMPYNYRSNKSLKGLRVIQAELKIDAYDSSRFTSNWQTRFFMNPYSDFTEEEQRQVDDEVAFNNIKNQTNLAGGLGYFNAVSSIRQKIILKVYMEWP